MLIFSLQTLRAAPITGSRPPFSVLKHSFHLLHAICIIVKISKRSVRGSGVRFSRGCRFFDWNIVTAHHRSVSLSASLSMFRWTARQRNVLHPPERMWTKLLPRHRSGSKANLCRTSSSNSPAMERDSEMQRGERWLIWPCKRIFFPPSRHHTNSTSFSYSWPGNAGLGPYL